MGHQFKIREREEIEDDSRLPDWVTKKKKKKGTAYQKNDLYNQWIFTENLIFTNGYTW